MHIIPDFEFSKRKRKILEKNASKRRNINVIIYIKSNISRSGRKKKRKHTKMYDKNYKYLMSDDIMIDWL